MYVALIAEQIPLSSLRSTVDEKYGNMLRTIKHHHRPNITHTATPLLVEYSK